MNDARARPVRLDRLAFLVAVAESGGFTAAARRLGTGKGHVSQQIARLEEELSGALFHRTTRRVALTAAGERLLERCAAPLSSLRAAVEGFSDAAGPLTGALRVTAPPQYGDEVVAPLLARFAALHPQLELELVCATEVLDLVAGRFDAAFRVGAPRDGAHRGVVLARFDHWAVAAPTYLARAGEPGRSEELAAHRLVALTALPAPARWRVVDPDGRARTVRLAAPLRANTPHAVVAMARAGAGVAILPDFSVRADVAAGRLRRLLPGHRLPGGAVHLLYPGARPPPKVRALVSFARTQDLGG